MATFINELVDIPAHCVNVSNGKYTYIYFTQKTYRNKDGQVRNERVCIGKKSDQDQKMIPNRRYYEIFEKEEPVHLPDVIRSCGSYAVCRKIANDLGLTNHLKKAFPAIYRDILTAAHYMLTSGSIMFYLDDWLDGSLSFSVDALDSVSVGRMFKEITDEEKNAFFRGWMKEKGTKEFIAYDVTSISSYSQKLEDVEFGYNRDKEKLPQINYGMYYCEESRIPVYYMVYPGSIVDKVHCTYMIDGTDALNLKKVYFVMDKGFFTSDNLKFITEKGHRFVITMPPSLKLYRELVDKNKDDIINNIDCKINDRLMYCKKVEETVYGFRMNVHIFYNQTKAADNAAAFYDKLNSMENDLSKMTSLPSKGSVYYDYFSISQNGNEIIFEKKKDEIKKVLSRCGFFLIAETVFSKSSSEILSLYGERDTIEKCFDDLKNEIDLDRIRCSKEETAAGKMFTSFVSLIILSQLRKRLSAYCFKKKTTMKKILLELDKIKVAYDFRKEHMYRIINPLTKKQKDILDALNMTDEIFLNLI